MAREDTVKAIRAALEHDPDINLHRYPIEIHVDSAVRLTGVVGDIRAKRKALRLARQAAGRDDILDELLIDTTEARGAQELRQAAVEALKQEPVFAEVIIDEGREAPVERRTGWIAVDTDGARVILHGVLDSLSHRRLAEVICWWVRGSADVDNRIHVEPPERETDAELADAVRLVLEKDPSIDASQLDIAAREAAVELRGAVATDEQCRIAELDCWYIPGVHGVDNELVARTP